MKLRPYQLDAKDGIDRAWTADNSNVLLVSPVGSGKTVLMADILREERGESVAIAHRQELVGQISRALAQYGVPHKLVAPDAVIRFCIQRHIRETGRSWFDPRGRVTVAGVDTLVRRTGLGRWADSVKLWVQDEAHHVLADNKWGNAASLFPNARGLGVTATPLRADGKGLGRHADGLMDTIVEGPTMRDLIDWGYLTDYRIWCPPSDIDMSTVTISNTGDYSQPKLRAAVQRSHIVGDVVKHYQRIAAGKLGVTFATDVETARHIAEQFQEAGVPAQSLSAKSPDAERAGVLDKLTGGELRQITNCDIFGEGFDLPAIDVVQLARPTESFGLFVQQCGRALRPVYAEGMPLDTPEQRRASIAAGSKPWAAIIDHAGNTQRHAVAVDGRIEICHREWSLDGTRKSERGKADDAIPVTVCPECTGVYERILPACPYCQHKPQPVSRSAPEFVDGDLQELDPGALQQIRTEIQRIDGEARIPRDAAPAVAGAIRKRHVERQQAQDVLREAISWWGGAQRAAGRSDPESYRLFWYRYGTDVLTAQTLGAREALDLAGRINEEVGRCESD